LIRLLVHYLSRLSNLALNSLLPIELNCSLKYFPSRVYEPASPEIMTLRRDVYTDEVAAPLQHVFSQAIVTKERIYCAGAIGLVKSTEKLVEGGIEAETVHHTSKT
jgi:enamine deaminase RidA (YjgF/YER057c/UK114 family)